MSGYVTLKVYNKLGKEVAGLGAESLPAGSYVAEWDGNGVASGVYFYRLESGNYLQVRKMVLLR
jgi:flagellar hook assembly protein FlgD